MLCREKLRWRWAIYVWPVPFPFLLCPAPASLLWRFVCFSFTCDPNGKSTRITGFLRGLIGTIITGNPVTARVKHTVLVTYNVCVIAWIQGLAQPFQPIDSGPLSSPLPLLFCLKFLRHDSPTESCSPSLQPPWICLSDAEPCYLLSSLSSVHCTCHHSAVSFRKRIEN